MALILHVAEATLVEPARGVVDTQLVACPVRVHVMTPAGVAALLGPVTVAVKVTLWPPVGDAGRWVTAIVGVDFATVKLSLLEGPTAL